MQSAREPVGRQVQQECKAIRGYENKIRGVERVCKEDMCKDKCRRPTLARDVSIERRGVDSATPRLEMELYIGKRCIYDPDVSARRWEIWQCCQSMWTSSPRSSHHCQTHVTGSRLTRNCCGASVATPTSIDE